MQAFRCESCGETLIWKGGGRSSWADVRPGRTAKEPEIHHVALSFKRVKEGRLAPGQAIECIDEQTAIVRAELMTREKAVAGAVAFSRRASIPGETITSIPGETITSMVVKRYISRRSGRDSAD